MSKATQINEELNALLDTGLELFLETELPDGKLPLNRHVLGFLYLSKSENEREHAESYHKSLVKYIPEILKKVMEPWVAVCIPTLTQQTVKNQISALLKRYKDSKRAIRRDRSKVNTDYLNELFYIAKCKCLLTTFECHCVPANQVPYPTYPGHKNEINIINITALNRLKY